jgi:hypothetical protein
VFDSESFGFSRLTADHPHARNLNDSRNQSEEKPNGSDTSWNEVKANRTRLQWGVKGTDDYNDENGKTTNLDSRIKKRSHHTPWGRLRGEEVQLVLILDLDTWRGWVVSVTPRPRINPGERTPCTHCTGGWVGLRTGVDTYRGKVLLPLPGIEPPSPGRLRSQTLYWLSYPGSLLVAYKAVTL